MACGCGCGPGDCADAQNSIRNFHQQLRQRTEQEFEDDLAAHEDWLIKIFLNDQVGPAMAQMSTEMGAVAVQYVQIIGSFLDAQIQMDTQRLFRKLQHEAHIDYTPSEDFCWFGTNVRSLAATGNKARFNALGLSQISLSRQVGSYRAAGSASTLDDYNARWQQFVTTYCNPRENNFQSGVVTGTNTRSGLMMACDHDGRGTGTDVGGDDPNRFNMDVNYTRLIEDPRTLEIDFSDNTLNVTSQPEASLYVGPIMQPGTEEDVIALSKNLYGHRVLSRELGMAALKSTAGQKLYLGLRTIAARRGVAQASFNAIVGLKSSGTSDEMGGNVPGVGTLGTIALAPLQSRRFLAAIVRELMPASPAVLGGNIFELIGFNPSYYSQLEILSKRIFQNPDFYARLYDTPANVSRKKVAMKAIELMVDREIYESQLRREMSVSVLLASKLRGAQRTVNKSINVSKGRDE